ncbi:MAG: hypothetical protein WC028_05880 [Candidatus Obscuribacterales bacterium]|jgi:hypothetical protein
MSVVRILKQTYTMILAILRQAYAYWKYGKSLAPCCAAHGLDQVHLRNIRSLGVPEVLAQVQHKIFMKLPCCEAERWQLSFLAALRPKVDLASDRCSNPSLDRPLDRPSDRPSDLAHIWPQFAIWLLDDPTYGVIRFAKTRKTRLIVTRVANLYRRGCSDPTGWTGANGDAIWAAEASRRWANSDSAAANAASSAASSKLADCLGDAIDEVARLAYSAVDHAAQAAGADSGASVDSAAITAAYIRQAEKLLELLQASNTR